jgi:hypothetical protein
MRSLVLAVTTASLLAAPAGAADLRVDRGNGSFFNKPGATAQAVATDTTRCREIAEGADSQINGVAVLAGGIGAVIGGAFAGGRLKRINIENCMLTRGWRLYAMTREEGAVRKALTVAQRDAELVGLVGSAVPARGTLLRQWRNDYAEPVLWQKN